MIPGDPLRQSSLLPSINLLLQTARAIRLASRRPGAENMGESPAFIGKYWWFFTAARGKYWKLNDAIRWVVPNSGWLQLLDIHVVIMGWQINAQRPCLFLLQCLSLRPSHVCRVGIGQRTQPKTRASEVRKWTDRPNAGFPDRKTQKASRISRSWLQQSGDIVISSVLLNFYRCSKVDAFFKLSETMLSRLCCAPVHGEVMPFPPSQMILQRAKCPHAMGPSCCSITCSSRGTPHL